MTAPLLQVQDLVREYTLPREHLFRAPGKVHALNGVSFSIDTGRSLGIVGESGSGKSTLARLVMALDPPTSGTVHLLGRDLHQLPPTALREARRDFQMVFQDPYGSLDPRQTVERIVTEPLQAQGQTTRAEQRETGIKTGQQRNQHRRAERDEKNLCARKRSPPHRIRGGNCRYLGYAHRYFLLLLTWFQKSCRRRLPGPA